MAISSNAMIDELVVVDRREIADATIQVRVSTEEWDVGLKGTLSFP